MPNLLNDFDKKTGNDKMLTMLIRFFIVFKDYLIEVLPFLALGFLLSGLIHEFVPTAWVERHLGDKGLKPIFYSVIAGAVLPICCIGSLPVAVSLHQKGAKLGPVLAFLVATPATSITALLVCYRLLGITFTVFIFLAVIVMGIIMGIIGNTITIKARTLSTQESQKAIDPVCGMSVETDSAPSSQYDGQTYYFCCSHCQQTFEKNPQGFIASNYSNATHRIKHILRYSFIDMVKEIGPELLLGLGLAALVVAITPVGTFIKSYFSGVLGYPFSLFFGMMMYICATASVPLVHAFISQGMNIGAAMVLLIVGPITSWGTILVLRKEFGAKVLSAYLLIISVTALIFGYLFSIVV